MAAKWVGVKGGNQNGSKGRIDQNRLRPVLPLRAACRLSKTLDRVLSNSSGGSHPPVSDEVKSGCEVGWSNGGEIKMVARGSI